MINETQAIVPSFDDCEILPLLQQHFQLSGTIKCLPGYCDQNLLLTTQTDEKYIVKIANPNEQVSELAMQNAAMAHLTTKEMVIPHALLNEQAKDITQITDNKGTCFSLRVLTYLPGDFYADSVNHSHALWRSLGAFMAQIDNSLNDFDHKGAYRFLDWDLAQGYHVCQSKIDLLEPKQCELVNHFLIIYHNQTRSVLAKCPMGIIHNDANDYNLLVDNKNQPTQITGLIDFGDMVHSHIVNELAVTSAYALMEQANPLEVLTTIVASYHSHKPLLDCELEVLFSLIALRLCMSVCNSAAAIQQAPDNDYLMISAQPAWQLLNKLRNFSPYAVLCRLRSACGLKVDTGKNKSDIINYRKKHLGKTLSLSYQHPLKIVQGNGAYLYDEQGTAYLDMVNNVCHVGHCHPKVVTAAQEQLAKLNTNTRYLHDNIINFSEKLLATMPDKLSVCMFVNSGSEANELAFRLARSFTKSKELIVVDGAYHGNTSACIEASPYKFDGPGGEGAAPHIHKVTLPDPYRGEFKGNTLETAHAYANSVTQVLSELATQKKQPGAFICESLQGVAGQIIMPNGYLSAVYKQVRTAGGVCIADEVQVGFGRVGCHMWAFETQNVIPDIVTLGKPIGNGHPMAAVITTQEIADAFVTGMEYFNTFGGNPVSCAIGEAVLDVIQEEKLQQHALITGNYLLKQLKQLQKNFNLIGDVRGLGLFIGVELVENTENKIPATEKTAWLVEFFKQHHILLSTEGPFYNVLKIKPPLAFKQEDADKFLQILQLGLTELSSKK